VLYEAYNTDGDYRFFIVSYGTMSRVCRTAIDMLKADGIEVGMIRPQTLFPFPDSAVDGRGSENIVHRRLEHRDEHGADGGGCGTLRQGRQAGQWYGKCGGDMPTPEEIIDVQTADGLNERQIRMKAYQQGVHLQWERHLKPEALTDRPHALLPRDAPTA
jgi:pyruvate/2-oxoacid:ferredoxin oxidoreductase alpha subunit